MGSASSTPNCSNSSNSISKTEPMPILRVDKNPVFHHISNIDTIAYTLFALPIYFPYLPRELLPLILLPMPLAHPYSRTSTFRCTDLAVEHPEQMVVVCGSSGVGKSALVIQFMQDYFVEDYDPTISDHYLKTTTIDETPFHIEIGDTAGLNLYEVHLLEDLRAANAAFIVVYAIDSRNSFRSIQYFMEKIWKQQCTHLVPIVLVGNKSDLMKAREVSEEEGLELAKEYGCPFYESSAFMRTNVDELFYDAIREKYRLKALLDPPRKATQKPNTTQSGATMMTANGD